MIRLIQLYEHSYTRNFSQMCRHFLNLETGYS